MTYKKKTFFRYCKNCGRNFKPHGKYAYLCPECNPNKRTEKNTTLKR